MSIVRLEEVHKIYPLGETHVRAVNGVTFSIERGDFISIAGPSGSGKSTILNMIGCIDTPTEGTVYIDDQPTSGRTDRQITRRRTHKPNELSGGQRQRVAIARALVTKPQIVPADEPTANLDSKTGEDIIGLMKKINRELETTFIFSTHDPSIVEIADHIIRLLDGNVTENRRTVASGAQA